MHIGTQLVAPEGYEQLSKGETYHFLSSKQGRTMLVHFTGWNGSEPGASLLVLNQGSFELGRAGQHIVPAPTQYTLPPWLRLLEGVDLNLLDLERPGAQKPHRDRVDERVSIISGALKDVDVIFSAPEPLREIHALARACRPAQNESRFRLWFLTYLAFGCNAWALLPPFCRIGHWPRLEHSGVKFGRTNLAHGRKYGHPSTPEMIEMMKQGYLKYGGPGVSMTKIYQKTMLYIFGCRSAEGANGAKLYFHPEGSPFPTFEQFRYRIHQAFGLEAVQRTLYGQTRHRARLAASKGKFSEEVENLLERVESDGYYTNERPRGFIEGTSLPALCVVVGRDVLSGMKTGIGFAFGKERHTAYRMMLFSMAVGKQFFCKLFGIGIAEGEWPCQGLPPYFRIDRGPGAKVDLIEDLEKRFAIKDMTPSWSGQSKATVESSHPRAIKIEGEPTYFRSDLTPVELARREIYKLLKYNHTADMSERIQPDPDMVDIQPSPIGLWNYYDSLMRTEAQPMTVADAVRTFLTATTFTVKHDGVWLKGQRYDSAELRDCGILERVARNNSLKISGFTLDLCVRHVWVEVDAKLLMLDAQMKVRGDDQTLYLSVADLDQWGEQRSKINAVFREHQHATASDYMLRFHDDTGKEWDAGKRLRGRPRKDETNRQEIQEASRQTAHRRGS
ncbi:MAG: transposase [Pseudomonadota bacterium]